MTVARKKKRGRRRHRHPALWIGGVLMIGLYVWAFYHFFVGPTGFRWRAMYGDAHYPQGYEIHGIDISHYQDNIDWNKLKQARVTGCPLRFVFVKSTEGASKVDKNFKKNFLHAKENGFIRGAYHFWSNKSTARQQAYFFLEKVQLKKGDLPPVLDIEHLPAEMNVKVFQRDVLEWLRIVESCYGVKPIIYTYYKFKESYLNTPEFEEYPFWIAHYYVPEMVYKGSWNFWQHTDAGKLPGIRGNVDLDVFNGSYYELLQMTIGGVEE